jgi:hypothetical protein
MAKRKEKTKGETVIFKRIYRRLRVVQHEVHYRTGMNSGAPDG